MVKAISDQHFEEKTSDGVVLVDFWAPWCGPCRMQSPIIEDLSEELEDEIDFFKMNVDDEPQTAQSFGIMSIPTLLVKKDGAIVEKLVGYHDRARLVEILSQYQ